MSFLPRPINQISLPGFAVFDTITTSDIIPIRNSYSIIGNPEHFYSGIFVQDVFTRNRNNQLENIKNIYQPITTLSTPLHYTGEFENNIFLSVEFPLSIGTTALKLNYAAPLYQDDSYSLSVGLNHPFSIENNKIKLNYDDDYLEIDEENNLLDWKPPFCKAHGLDISFVASGENLLDFLGDWSFGGLFDGLNDWFEGGIFDEQEGGILNKPMLLAKVKTGIGLKIDSITGNVAIDLIAGLHTTITGNVISMSWDYVSEITLKKNEALSEIEVKKDQALAQITTRQTQATTAITTAQSTATSAISTAQGTATSAISSQQAAAISAITSSQTAALSAITTASTTATTAITTAGTSAVATITATVSAGEIALGSTISAGLASITAEISGGTALLASTSAAGVASIQAATSSGLFQIGAASAAALAAITIMGFFARPNPSNPEEEITYLTVVTPVENNDAANKIYVDEQCAIVNGNANSRLLQSTFDSFLTTNTSNINSRVLQTDYDIFKNDTETSLLSKVDHTALSYILTGYQPLSSYLTIIDQNLSIASSPSFSTLTVNSGGALQFQRDEGTSNIIGAKLTGTGFSSVLRFFNGSGTALGRIDFAASPSISPYMTFGPSSVWTNSVLLVANTTDATNSTTGSIIISGGVGIAKSLRVGGVSAFSSAVAVGNPTAGSHAVNRSWLDNTISTVNTSIGTKLDTSIYDAFVISNTSALALKASISYVDTGLALKVDLTTYNSFLATNTSNLALKSSITYVDTGLATKVDNSTYNTFLTTNTSNLALKSSITYVDTGLATKVDNSTYNTFVTSTNNSISTLNTSVASKVSQSSFDAFYTATNTSLGQKVVTNSNGSLTTLLTNVGTNSGGQGHYFYQSQLVNRWLTGLYGEEGVGNTGCDWILTSYDNTGNYILHAMKVKRATGELTLAGKITMLDDRINDRSISADRTTLDGLSTTILTKADTSYVNTQLALKQNVLANISNVSTINQNLSTTSDVVFNKLTIGNGSISTADGNNAFIISGGAANTNRYVYIVPNTPVSGTYTNLLYTTSAFTLSKANGSASLTVNNTSGLVTVGDISVTTLNNITTTELAQIANINSVSIPNAQWTILGNLNQDLNSSSAVTFSNVLLGTQSANVAACTRRDYVDGISYITAGTGLTKTGSTLSVNASQSQITSLGTLTGLTSSGVVNVTNTTVSTSSTTGSVIVSGGVGIGGSVFVAGKISATTGTLSTELITKGSVDTLVGLRVLQSAYDTQVSTFTTDISNRLMTSTYNSFLTTNQAALDLKASISYVDAQVGLRVLQSAYNTQVSTFTTDISNRLLTSTYNSFLTTNQAALDNKVTIGSSLSVTTGSFSDNVTLSKTAAGSGTTYISQSFLTSSYGLVISGGITQGTGSTAKFEMKNNATIHPLITVDGSVPRVQFQQTADSSSTTTGSVQLLGGMGIAKKLYVGGGVNVTGTSIFNNTTTFYAVVSNNDVSGVNGNFSGSLNVNTINSTGTTGPFSIDPNYTTNNYVRIWDELRVDNGSGYVKITGNDITASTGTFNGVVTSGSTGKFIGKSFELLATSGSNRTTMFLNGADESQVLSFVNISGTTPGEYCFWTSNGGTKVLELKPTGATFSMGVTCSSITVSNSVNADSLAIAGSSNFTSTTDSSSSTTGAAKISGGMGVAKSLYVGNDIVASNVWKDISTNTINLYQNNVAITVNTGSSYMEFVRSGRIVHFNCYIVFSSGSPSGTINSLCLDFPTTDKLWSARNGRYLCNVRVTSYSNALPADFKCYDARVVTSGSDSFVSVNYLATGGPGANLSFVGSAVEMWITGSYIAKI